MHLRTGGPHYAGASTYFVTVMLFVVLWAFPTASRTVSVTGYEPLRLKSNVMTAPVTLPPGGLPRFHAYETIPWSSVDVRPSNVHVVRVHE